MNDWSTGEITLSVNGAPLKLKISVPSKRVKPLVMLPTFQKLANAFTDLGVQQAEAEGKTISCQKGCGACCRQPVPLAETEIHYISLLVDVMPEPRRSELRLRFEAAAVQFHNNGWYNKFENCRQEDELKQLILEYFFQRVACPFLEEESCSIHPYRPVACREYLVTSPAENCANPVPGVVIDKVPLPVNVSDGLSKMALSGNLYGKKFLPMVFALEWAEQHPERFTEKTGEAWLAEFFGG